MLLLYDFYNYYRNYNYIFSVLIILEIFFIVPLPHVLARRGAGRKMLKKKMKGEGNVLLTKRVKLHWGVTFIRGTKFTQMN